MTISTPNLKQAVDKAVSRANELGLDLDHVRKGMREVGPDQLASEPEKRERRRFLESLYDESREADLAFERIIAGNELQDANFLTRGALVARAVVRVVIRAEGGRIIGYGTGFFVGDRVLITNNHVLPNSDVARASDVEAYYERGLVGEDIAPVRFALDPGALWKTSKDLDFTLVGVAPRDRANSVDLSSLGWLPLIGGTGKAVEGEWLTVIQHPKGERKQLCVRENQLMKRDTDVLWYSTDTLAGSSGSPVFNNDWLVIALHHSGVPKIVDGKWQTIDGRDYDPDRDDEDRIQWVANEGIRISRILEVLRTDNTIANHPLVAPLLRLDVGDINVHLPVQFADGHMPHRFSIAGLVVTPFDSESATAPSVPIPAITTPLAKETTMTKRLVTITLAIEDDGSVSVAGPQSREADLLVEASAPKKKTVIDAPVIPADDWQGGYDAAFLGPKHIVHLPTVTDDLKPFVTRLKQEPAYGRAAPDGDTAAAGVLNYNGYSVVMHDERKIAIFSAANINGGVEFPNLSRPTDRWLYDDRIGRDKQVGPSFYTHNKIDRGHLTRREDMEWGSDPVDATRRANGTCTWTNCSPQHKLFNQDKNPDPAIRLWGGLEKYILEQTARHYGFRVTAITGPIFDQYDPEYRGIQIPLQFWKVVIAVDADDKLFATGYILSQSGVLDVGDLEEAAIAEPFGKFQTYQRPLAEIEDATGLHFTYGEGKPMREVDPLAIQLAQPIWKRRRRPSANPLAESFQIDETIGSGTLTSFEDIVLP